MTQNLQARMREDLTAAIRSRDELRSSTLRMAMTAVRIEEVSGSVARTLDDAQVVVVLGREARKRREAATAFSGGGREDRAQREREELVVLEGYLPTQLSDDELTALVAEAVRATGSEGAGMAAMGRVMKELQPRVAGQAEGSRVAAAVRAALG